MARSDWHRPSEFSAEPGRRRVALTLCYDGRAFCGWQTQNGWPSVQQTLLEATVKLTGISDITICGSGRTDSKVHAMGQVAHIELPDSCRLPAKAFLHGLNALLPYTVRITESHDALPSFHARYSAMAREYRYFWAVMEKHNPFLEGLVSPVKRIPDLNLLNSYAEVLKGTHDFTTFTGSGDQSPSKVRDIYLSDFEEEKSMYGLPMVRYRICGNAFLYHMVRSLCGTMMSMALEGRSESEFKDILLSKDRGRAAKTADPGGLYLWRISYDPEEFRWFEDQY